MGLEPRSIREGVIQEITEKQWSALAALLERARERGEALDGLSIDEVNQLDGALRALSGAQDIEHGLRNEQEFFRAYPHLVPPWRRGG